MVTRSAYLQDPCRASSLPFWKENTVEIPDHMMILREDQLLAGLPDTWEDEPYFKLLHDLREVKPPKLPDGFVQSRAGTAEFAAHITSCYSREGITAEELSRYRQRPVYREDLWIAVSEASTGRLSATGIGELDPQVGEGILDWIQVSPECRGRGLGEYLVRELLWRMKGQAGFVTVSGRLYNETNPASLYRRCGFRGETVWHILTQK